VPEVDALVIYDSRFGNTECVARAIAEGLSEQYRVRAVTVAEADLISRVPDLLVIGGPTQKRHLSPQLRILLDGIPRGGLRRVEAATFDTRYRMSRILSGSAAREAARRLTRTGCRLVVPPESFFMEKDVPPKGEKRRHGIERLEEGELDRAREWAVRLAARTRGRAVASTNERH
jgi:flavodoxin